MRGRPAAFVAKVKERALEWAATTVLASVLTAVLLVEELIASWVVLVDPIWIVRSFIALLVPFFGYAIWLIWTVPRPRFDQLTGTYVDKKIGWHYCTPCYLQKLLAPLRREAHGWVCLVCKQYFHDPARPRERPPERQPKDGGPLEPEWREP